MSKKNVLADGLCSKCHTAPRTTGSYCAACGRLRWQEYKARKARGEARAPREMGGRCSQCGGPKGKTSSWCNSCCNAAAREKRRKLGVVPRADVSTPEKFWERVAILSPDECWEWLAGRFDSGYGQVWVPALGQSVGAHVYAWELANGAEVPGGSVVRHLCDHKICVNPRHLLLGTQADNIRDKVSRERQARGERHGMARISEETARLIWQRVQRGESPSAVARSMGIGLYTAWGIAGGKTWRHVTQASAASEAERASEPRAPGSD